MEKKWLNLGETGQLYLEQILVTFDIPILFVCNGFENRKYLCQVRPQITLFNEDKDLKTLKSIWEEDNSIHLSPLY